MHVVIIQARMASTRHPGKILLELFPGTTILDFLIERVTQAKKVGRVVVATSTNNSDLELVKYCELKGYEIFRGSEIDCLDRHYQCGLSIGASSVSKIPSDVPFIDPILIDKNISLFETGSFDFVSTLHPPTFPDGMDIETMSFKALKKAWENASKPFEREHTTPYIWDNPNLFKIGAIKSDQNRDYFMEYRLTIDYQKDLEFMREVYKKYIIKNHYFTWQGLIKFLNRSPDVFSINKMYVGVNWYGKYINQLKTFDTSKTKYDK